MASTAATIESRLPHRLAETRARAQAESNVGIGHLRFPRLKTVDIDPLPPAAASLSIAAKLAAPFQRCPDLLGKSLDGTGTQSSRTDDKKQRTNIPRREDRATLSGAVATFLHIAIVSNACHCWCCWGGCCWW